MNLVACWLICFEVTVALIVLTAKDNF